LGKNGSGSNSICHSCQNKLTPVKLYAPEILRLFKEGHKEFSRHGILVSYAACLSPHCKVGMDNLNSYDRIVSDGMIKVE
jgi:hypothetical protein